MKYLRLGDRDVSRIGLGFWQYGSREWGMAGQHGTDAGRAAVDEALRVGINLFDTAELYGRGRSEEILGAALKGRRDEAYIATKVTPTHLWRRRLVRAADESLARLDMDVIDLYQVHWPNRFVPPRSTMRGMRDLLESGSIRAVGVSNYSLRRWRRAERALGDVIVANQVQFHLLDQGPMEELVPFVADGRRAIIAYSPLAQGVLGGRYDASNLPDDFRAANPMFTRDSFEHLQPALDELSAVAKAHDATMAQVALAWLLHIPGVIAIPGARDAEQVRANAAAADIDLTNAEWRGLRDIFFALQPKTTRGPFKRALAWILGA